MAAARTTLGSVRASSTKPTMPDGPDGVQPAATHPAPPAEHQQEADDEGQVGAGHGQQVGEAGRPEVVGQPGVQARVVAVDQRRHQRPLARRSVAPPTSRIDVTDRLGAPPPHVRVRSSSSGSPRAETTAASPGSSAGESRAVVRSVLPSRTSSHDEVAEHQHRRRQLVGRPAPGDADDVPAHQHPVAVPAGDHPRVGRRRGGRRSPPPARGRATRPGWSPPAPDGAPRRRARPRTPAAPRARSAPGRPADGGADQRRARRPAPRRTARRLPGQPARRRGHPPRPPPRAAAAAGRVLRGTRLTP